MKLIRVKKADGAPRMKLIKVVKAVDSPIRLIRVRCVVDLSPQLEAANKLLNLCTNNIPDPERDSLERERELLDQKLFKEYQDKKITRDEMQNSPEMKKLREKLKAVYLKEKKEFVELAAKTEDKPLIRAVSEIDLGQSSWYLPRLKPKVQSAIERLTVSASGAGAFAKAFQDAAKKYLGKVTKTTAEKQFTELSKRAPGPRGGSRSSAKEWPAVSVQWNPASSSLSFLAGVNNISDVTGYYGDLPGRSLSDKFGEMKKEYSVVEAGDFEKAMKDFVKIVETKWSKL